MLASEYFSRIIERMENIKNTQMDEIDKAAAGIATRLEKGGLLYVFGSGHSHVLAEEIHERAGGLVQTRPILPYELTMEKNVEKGAMMERADGLGEILLTSYKVRDCDALIIISNSGRNAVPVQMAETAKNLGIFTIGITNLAHSKSVTSRLKNGKKLYELCDVVIDNGGPLGDALVPVPNKNYSIAPASTILGALIIELLVCSIVETMISNGIEPLILRSANLDGSDELNRKAREQLKERFPELQKVFTTF